jgi:hypothetical protein
VEARARKLALNRGYREQSTTYAAVLEAFDRLGPTLFREWLVEQVRQRKPKAA